MIAVGGDQAIATLKAGDIRDLRIRQLQSILHPDCLVILQIQHNFGFGIIDDAFAILATVQCKEIVQVLCSCDSCSTVASNDLEDLQAEFSSHGVAAGTYQLPDLVNEDGLFFCAVFLGLVPNEVKCHEHTHSKQVTSQLRNVQNRVGV